MYRGTVANEKEGLCKSGKKQMKHKIKTVVSLQSDPQVLMFNVNWKLAPERSHILKFMLTISDTFHRDELFEETDLSDYKYAFKGCILFSGAHYRAMFRQLDENTWTVYDDEHVKVLNSWREAIEFCLEVQTFPTILFYEKTCLPISSSKLTKG